MCDWLSIIDLHVQYTEVCVWRGGPVTDSNWLLIECVWSFLTPFPLSSPPHGADPTCAWLQAAGPVFTFALNSVHLRADDPGCSTWLMHTFSSLPSLSLSLPPSVSQIVPHRDRLSTFVGVNYYWMLFILVAAAASKRAARDQIDCRPPTPLIQPWSLLNMVIVSDPYCPRGRKNLS